MRGFSQRLGLVLSIAAGASCAVLHIATFVTAVPIFWLILPVALLAGLVFCSEQAGTQRSRALISIKGMGLLNAVLLAYVVLTYWHVLRANGWTSNVSVVDGGYVAMQHGHVIRTITEHEYRMFATLWARAGSALMAMMVSVGLTHLSD